MAKFELKFIDCFNKFVTIEAFEIGEEIEIRIESKEPNYENSSTILIDKSTAIKLAKTLRTEINKIT
jgi:hypothetical protein